MCFSAQLLVLGVLLGSLTGFAYLVFMKFCVGSQRKAFLRRAHSKARPFIFGVPILLLLADVAGCVYFLAFLAQDEEKAEHVLLWRQVKPMQNHGKTDAFKGVQET